MASTSSQRLIKCPSCYKELFARHFVHIRSAYVSVKKCLRCREYVEKADEADAKDARERRGYNNTQLDSPSLFSGSLASIQAQDADYERPYVQSLSLVNLSNNNIKREKN